ncbi:MAG: hypothetical protein KKA84_05275 [Bacteroidetes bacterium]|nr:hypothetical protein [Bacteroidota bacterium]
MKYIALLFFISASIIATPKIQNEKLKSIEQEQLAIKKHIDSLDIVLSKIVDKIKENEIRLESVDALVSTSNNYLSIASWAGGIITALLFFIGIYSIISFSLSKREIDKHLEKSKTDVEEAKTRFNDFINSPLEIKEVIENINYREIIDGLSSEEERIFNVNITRAYNLPTEKRIEIANIIKSKLYDPNYYKLFFQIYYFLKQNLDVNVNNYAYKLWNDFHGNAPNNGEHMLITDIFSAKPFPIQPFAFLNELIKSSKTNLLHFMISSLDNDEFIELLKESVLANLEIDYNSLLHKMDEMEFELTSFVKDNVDKIDENTFDKLHTKLKFDKDIINDRLKKNNNLNESIDKYIRNVVAGPNEFSFLADQIELSKKQRWIELFNFYLKEDPQELKNEILWDNYKEAKDTLPKDEFFINDLPLFFEKNYGIIKKDHSYFYRSIEISPINESNFFTGQTYSVVVHPILNKKIHIDRIK